MTEDQILEDELLLDLMDEKNHSSVHWHLNSIIL
jgi:hypothetical protein